MIIFDAILYFLLAVLIWILTIVIFFSIVYGKQFKRLWQEPMLRQAVVIFDSDDWGTGPKEQAEILKELLLLLTQYQDKHQHYPVLTLGVILAEPDVERIKADTEHYYSRDLRDERYKDLVQIIKQGDEKGIFAIHLHGMEHFWPASLMAQLQREDVQQWLFKKSEHSTEDLPSFLQSRWCDTSKLPSIALKAEQINKAIVSEINCFKTVFKQSPKVLVPPTFVWTEQVSQSYLNNNVRLIMTPGRQFTGRDASGGLISNGRTFYNGECEQKGCCYLVRDIYFEPELGHKAERVVTDIKAHTEHGRPALIEMHRFNFLKNKTHSLSELKKILDMITEQLPETLFLSAEQLIACYQSRDQQLLLSRFSERLMPWIKRIQHFLQDKRLAKYTGFNQLLGWCCK